MPKFPFLQTYIIACIMFALILFVLPEETNTFTTVVSVDRIEGNVLVLITESNYVIHADKALFPEITEGDVLKIEYTIDVEASAELRNEIVTLQTRLLERN